MNDDRGMCAVVAVIAVFALIGVGTVIAIVSRVVGGVLL